MSERSPKGGAVEDFEPLYKECEEDFEPLYGEGEDDFLKRWSKVWVY